MATTTDLELRGGVRPARYGIATSGDRTREFRQARRRTVVVRLLRWGLPATCVGLCAIYMATVLKTAGWGTNLPDISIRKILPEDLTMNNPRYEGFGKDGSSYVFNAKTAQQDLTTPNIIKLFGITGTIFQADKTKTDVAAVRGTFDHAANMLDLFEQIDVASESGLKAKLTQATITIKDNLLVSKEPVLVEFPAGPCARTP
jgi:hypothetical protein